MSKTVLPYQLQDGQKVYAARIMANFQALVGGLNQIQVNGLPSGDLETVLGRLKQQLDQTVTADQQGNAGQIRFADGDTFQEKLETGALKGVDGVVSTSDGMYYFQVGADGHLYLITRSQVQGEAFSINDQGHLIYSIGDLPTETGEPKTYDLGNVRGPKGESGDMAAQVYDPSGKRQDIYAYVEEAVSAAAASRTVQTSVYQAGWSDNQNVVSLPELGESDHFYVSYSSSSTEDQRRAWRDGNLFVSGQTRGRFTLQADGAIPAVDIPVDVLILP